MADYQKVEINERSEEENISLEQQAQMQAEAAEQQPEGDRPQWLDEKFESPEDLAKAYQELQAKQSKGEGEEAGHSRQRGGKGRASHDSRGAHDEEDQGAG